MCTNVLKPLSNGLAAVRKCVFDEYYLFICIYIYKKKTTDRKKVRYRAVLFSAKRGRMVFGYIEGFMLRDGILFHQFYNALYPLDYFLG